MKAPAIPCPPAQPFSLLDAAEASRWTPTAVYPQCQTNACCGPRSSSPAGEPSITNPTYRRV